MRVAINCRSFITQHITGIGRYTYNLVDSLSKIDHENEYLLYVKKRPLSRNKKVPSIQAKNFSMKIDWFNRGVERTLKDVDVYHSPSFDFLDIQHTKIVVTIHDLVYKAYPQGHTQETIATTERQLQSIVQQASKIICSSKNTLHDLQKYFQIDRERICVIYPGVNKKIFYRIGPQERAHADALLQTRGIDAPFILFVGTIEPRKNLDNLVRAFAILREKKRFSGKLVVVGMTGWKTEGICDLIQVCGVEDRVVFLGYVSDDELRACYNQAEVFVFPSHYEGFGFPIVEAFSCGSAVVTSHGSSCQEVAQDAAVLIDPNRPEQICEAIANIVNDHKLQADLQEKALQRAERFSFAHTAEKTLEVYEQVYQKAP